MLAEREVIEASFVSYVLKERIFIVFAPTASRMVRGDGWSKLQPWLVTAVARENGSHMTAVAGVCSCHSLRHNLVITVVLVDGWRKLQPWRGYRDRSFLLPPVLFLLPPIEVIACDN
ncbi:MAG: hypothetical protein WAT91_18155 [Saprospiraceae bacterium]